MSDKQIELLARKAEREENSDLAVVLYVYLGSKRAGVTSDFARYCQDWAKAGVEWIELEQKINKIRRNN
jgi:hypothetical protein